VSDNLLLTIVHYLTGNRTIMPILNGHGNAPNEYLFASLVPEMVDESDDDNSSDRITMLQEEVRKGINDRWSLGQTHMPLVGQLVLAGYGPAKAKVSNISP
jgi:hypothetical protein